MLVKEIMTKHMDTLPPKASLREASSSMLKHNFGFLPVEKNARLVGIVTDRDITVHGVAKNLKPDAPLEQVMTKKVIVTHEDDDVTTAASIMEQKNVRRLVVLDQNEKISGIISLSDIATKCEHIDLSRAIMRAVSEKS